MLIRRLGGIIQTTTRRRAALGLHTEGEGAATTSASPTAVASPATLSPVTSEVEGEGGTTADYADSLVGLRLLYDVAQMILYDDPFTLASSEFTPGSEVALQSGYMGDSAATMWIIKEASPVRSAQRFSDCGEVLDTVRLGYTNGG